MNKRRARLTTLIALSALSAVALYVVQGALATGADVSAFPAWFWVLDYALWGCRALIEAAVIVYLFSTKATTPAQVRMLAVFEFALIALITLTVGPALRAVGLRQTMAESVSEAAFTAWSFGIAAYTSLMVGAAGYAFRVQPEDAGASDIDALRNDIARGKAELAQAQDIARQWQQKATQTAQAVEAWGLLSKTARAELIARCANGDRPDVAVTADALGVSGATVRRGYQLARDAPPVEIEQIQKGDKGE